MSLLRPEVREALAHLDAFRTAWSASPAWPEAEAFLRSSVWADRARAAGLGRSQMLGRLIEHAVIRLFSGDLHDRAGVLGPEGEAVRGLLRDALIALCSGSPAKAAVVDSLCRALDRQIAQVGPSLASARQAI